MKKNNQDKIKVFIDNVLKTFHIKLSDSKEELLAQVFKFVIVGGIATILDWCIYYVLFNYFKVDPLISNVCSFSISLIYNYYASVKWVFNVNDKKNKKKVFFEFVLFSLIGLLLTEGMLYLGVNKMHIDAMAVKIFATVIVMIFNFITRKMFLE